MKTKVDTYKNFEIYFDSNAVKFIIEGEDTREEKRSFPACKKYINDFIKENKLFGEFQIIKFPTDRYADATESQPVTVKGIHSNGNFLCEKSDGTKFQLSGNYEYDLSKYCLPEHLEQSAYRQDVIDDLQAQYNAIRAKVKLEEAKLPKGIYNLMQEVKKENQHLWQT